MGVLLRVLEHEVLKVTMKSECDSVTYFLNFLSDLNHGNGANFFPTAEIRGAGDPPTLLTPFLKHFRLLNTQFLIFASL